MRAPIGSIALTVALAGCDASGPTSSLAGEWGGPHVGVIFATDSASLEFDCAGGKIRGAITLDAQGHFAKEGTYTPGGGPARIDDSTRAVPARYDGAVRGRGLTITVILTVTNVVLGPFDLFRGGNPHVYKCD